MNNMDKATRERFSILIKNASPLPGQDKRRLYGNNYRLEPTKKFTLLPVEKIIKELLHQTLQNEPYNASNCQRHCINLSAELRTRVKMLNFSRYKFVCIVSISESRCSELLMSSRCLWDLKFDNYAWYKFENRELIAVGIVYGCYFE